MLPYGLFSKVCTKVETVTVNLKKTLVKMAVVEFVPAGEWVAHTLLYLIGASLCVFILILEIRTRIQTDVTFTTKSLEYTSLSCILCAVLTGLFWFLDPFWGFCHFSVFIGNIFVTAHYASMALYQLARLYYCFANNQIHSKKGYPKWMFIVITSLWILCAISWSISTIYQDEHAGLKSNCGINTKLQHYYISAEPAAIEYGSLWTSASFLVMILLDFTTLLLYGIKIRSFINFHSDSTNKVNKNSAIFKRVLSILYKIFILSIFYQLLSISFNTIIMMVSVMTESVWGEVINNFLTNAGIVAISFAMYLMMEHNEAKYVKFLRLIQYFKLNYICCKYLYIVDDQLKELAVNDETDMAISIGERKEKREKDYVENTNYDTRDQTLPTIAGPPQPEETVDVSVVFDDK